LRARRRRREHSGQDQGKSPSHARHYSRSAAIRLGVAASLLALSACANDRAELQRPGWLGRLIDTPSPPVTVVAGGPSGVLVSGPYVPDVPDLAVDGVIGSGLKEWLTFEERRSLAMASQRAAIGVTGTPLPWRAQDGGDAVTASGSAVAVGDVFRSLRGPICRDVRQSIDKNGDKNGEPHAQTITLCRTSIATGVILWLAQAD
jgi:hypothetical protein